MSTNRFITEQFIDTITGLNFGRDARGDVHLLEFLNNAADNNLPKNSIYLKAFCERIWDSTLKFQSIRDTLFGERKPMYYEIPTNRELRLDNIIAVQSGEFSGISLVSLHENNKMFTFFPIQTDLYYNFNEKIIIKNNFEVKFKPFHNRTKLSIFVHGVLI